MILKGLKVENCASSSFHKNRCKSTSQIDLYIEYSLEVFKCLVTSVPDAILQVCASIVARLVLWKCKCKYVVVVWYKYAVILALEVVPWARHHSESGGVMMVGYSQASPSQFIPHFK